MEFCRSNEWEKPGLIDLPGQAFGRHVYVVAKHLEDPGNAAWELRQSTQHLHKLW
jgi:hypothetical protein